MPVAADGFFGETLMHVIDMSLVGCRIIHLDRLILGSSAVVRATFAGVEIRASARVVRSKFVFRGGAAFYETGLQFSESLRSAPDDVECALTAVLEEQMPLPSLSRATAPKFAYLNCVPSTGGWRAIPTHDAHQPRDGFTMPWPQDETEISTHCKTFDVADAEKRRLMRLAFELTIAANL